MEAVSVVTIKNKIDLFKGEEKAERIELIELEEVGFKLVSQKGLYEIGDKAIYIQPDYNLPDTELFESLLRPGGQESKSMLGKVGGVATRIRAKKFTFHTGDYEHVYSNGILLPYNEVLDYIDSNNKDIYVSSSGTLEKLDLVELLQITKWEEPEKLDKNGNVSKGNRSFPNGVYKTDENNINNLWNHIEKNIGYPLRLVGTEKIDGSSITIGIKDKRGFICSRNLEKSLFIKKHSGKRKKTWLEKILFWKKIDLNLYTEVRNDDDFVINGEPILNLLSSHEIYGNNYILRGELNGGSMKGSGNKNNPASKEKFNIKIFGVDSINELGIAERVREEEYIALTNELGLERPKQVFNMSFESREQLEAVCNEYFKENVIEGIVVRNLTGSFSAKFMNLYYDSKK
jgi:hypothetical protein